VGVLTLLVIETHSRETSLAVKAQVHILLARFHVLINVHVGSHTINIFDTGLLFFMVGYRNNHSILRVRYN